MIKTITAIVVCFSLSGQTILDKEKTFLSTNFERCFRTFGEKKELSVEEFKKESTSDKNIHCETTNESTIIKVLDKEVVFTNKIFEKRYSIVSVDNQNQLTIYKVQNPSSGTPIFIQFDTDKVSVHHSDINKKPSFTFYLE